MSTYVDVPASERSDPGMGVGRFGAGLTEVEVRRFQNILREECGTDLSLPETWSRAIELLSLVEMLLRWRGVVDLSDGSPTTVRASSLLTDSRS